MADFQFNNHGSICILVPLSVAGQEWADDHLPDDVLSWGQNGIIIEPRYAGAILEGIGTAGLTVEA